MEQGIEAGPRFENEALLIGQVFFAIEKNLVTHILIVRREERRQKLISSRRWNQQESLCRDMRPVDPNGDRLE